MNEAFESLTKLAGELTDRVDALERENAQLREENGRLSKEALAKTAAEEQKPQGPVVSEETADRTLDCLLKAGALEQSQADASRKILLSDAEAPHRILQQILNAGTQVKTASDDADVSGGSVVGAMPGSDNGGDCMDRVLEILSRQH